MQVKWRDSAASPSICPNASLPPAAVQREHQQVRARTLYEIVDPDTVDRCEWHGVSCPVSGTTGVAVSEAGKNYKRRGSCTAIFRGPTRREDSLSCFAFSPPGFAT